MKENKQIVEHIFSNSKKMNKQPKQTTETTHKMISNKQTKIDDSKEKIVMRNHRMQPIS